MTVAFEPCRSTDAEQTDRIVTNILADYKTEVHPKAKDDGGVVMKISLVPLHIAMVQPSSDAVTPLIASHCDYSK